MTEEIQVMETLEPGEAPRRWSERFPLRAALVYTLVYLLVAAAGGYLSGLRLPILVVVLLITVIGTTTMGLSLLLVLSVCRLPLRARSEACLLLPTGVLLLLLRPELSLPLGKLLHAPPALVKLFILTGMLPGANLIGNVSLILFAVFVGRLVSHIIREGKLLLPVAIAASLADIITVFWGFVGHVAEQAPAVVEALSAQAPIELPKGVPAPILTSIGLGDFLFLGIFFAVALRYSMHAVKAMWAAFAAMLVAAVVFLFWSGALPGLPFISAGVLLTNRRFLTFTREEKRSLAIAAALLLVGIGLLAVKLVL